MATDGGIVNVSASDAVAKIHMTVALRGVKRTQVRLWIAYWLIKLAITVGGFAGVDLVDEIDGKTE